MSDMETHLNEEQKWAGNVASRLRLLQASLADENAANRQEYLGEEVERALREVAPAKRKGYLQVLQGEFPDWQIVPLPSGPPSTGSQIVEDSPELRLESLLSVVDQLDPEQKSQFAQRLQKAGLGVESESSESGLRLPEEMHTKLGLAVEQSIQAERAAKLLSILLEQGLILDQLVWNLWKQLAPRSALRREGGNDLGANAGVYLSGDGEMSIQQLAQTIGQGRTLTAGLLMAIGGVGRTYAKKHLERFAPEVIKDWAEMTKGWGGIEQKCWRKYLELANEYVTEPVIEKEIQDAIARYAEEVMRGRYASTDHQT